MPAIYADVTHVTYAYGDDPYSTVRITGARIPEAHEELAIWCSTGACRKRLAAMSAYEVSLAHAFYEADALAEWTFFVCALSPEDRDLARTLGLLD